MKTRARRWDRPRARSRSGAIAVALVLLAIGGSSAAHASTLTIESLGDDPIGLGVSETFDASTGTVVVTEADDLNGDGAVDSVTFLYLGNDPGRTWQLTFATAGPFNANTGNLVPGVFAGAEQATFASDGAPGLDFALDGRAADTLTGSFTITAAVFEVAAGGGAFVVRHFDATFEQFADGATDGLTGSFSYVPAPQPAADRLSVGALSGLALLRWRRRSRSASRRSSAAAGPFRDGSTKRAHLGGGAGAIAVAR